MLIKNNFQLSTENSSVNKQTTGWTIRPGTLYLISLVRKRTPSKDSYGLPKIITSAVKGTF